MKTIYFILVVIIICFKISAIQITIDPENKYQKISGFGCHLYNWGNEAKGYYQTDEFVNDYIDDLGNTLVRCELHPNLLVNELPLDKMDDYNNYKSDTTKDNVDNIFKSLAKLSIKSKKIKIIGTVWSPPAWMKSNKKTSSGGELDIKYYKHFAAYLYQYYKFLQDKYGVSLYAISIQNELRFYEPYNSCIYTKEQYRDVLKIVGNYFKEKGCSIKFYGTEDMTNMSSKVISYIESIMADKDTGEYLSSIATHGYSNGVISDGGSITENLKLYNELKKYNKDFWMTETSGESWKWDDNSVFYENGNPSPGALNGLAVKMHTALVYGFISAWTYWSFAGNDSKSIYSLGSNENDWKYVVHKHYSKYIRPDYHRIYAAPDNVNGILVSAFLSDKEDKLVLVMINTKLTKQQINLQIPINISVNNIKRYESNGKDKFQLSEENPEKNNIVFKINPNSINTIKLDIEKINLNDVNNILPEIECDKESCESDTAIPVTLSVYSGYGYFSTNNGKDYQRFDMLYDNGKKTILVKEDTKLMYYAMNDRLKSKVFERDYKIISGKRIDEYLFNDPIIIEAENYNNIISGKGDFVESTWKAVEGPNNSIVMHALPIKLITDAKDDGPAIEYRVNFNKTGKYYFWVRGCGPFSYDSLLGSTIYYGLDGKVTDYMKFQLALQDKPQSLPYNYMLWRVATIDITEAGIHSIIFKMKADNFMLDKFIISNKENFTPDDYISVSTTPKNFKISKIQCNKLYLNWLISNDTYGYKIYYRKYGEKFYPNRYINIENKNTTEVEFNKLNVDNNNADGMIHADTQYEFQISSYSPQGESLPSEIASAKTEKGGSGGNLQLENAKIAGYPIPNSGIFYSEGYQWRWQKCSSEYTTLGSLENKFKRAVVFWGDKSEIVSEKIPGGISNISFRISRHGFATGAEFAIFINDTEVARTNKLSDNDKDIYQYTFPGINIPGDVIIKIKNLTSENGTNSRGTFADFEWTGYIDNAPEPPNRIINEFSKGNNNIAWNKVNDAISYRVYREVNDKYYKLIGEVKDALKYTDTSSVKPFSYKITAVNKYAESKLSKISEAINE
jgi:O-glycosyl hydrolase